jgi:cytochrome c-type biogenesis protein CcmH/NrfF
VEPAGTVESTGGNATAEPPATASSGGNSRALAWWMAGEVGVLVVGGAIWCRRTTRRQAPRVAPVRRAEAPATSVALAGRADHRPAERHPSPRYRL